MAACVLCEPFSAHEAYHVGMLTDIAPALKVDGKFVRTRWSRRSASTTTMES